MKDFIHKIAPYYQEIRHKIHAHPELRYEEKVTAKLVSDELKKLGLIVQEQVGKTGVVGILDSGKPGKTIAFRADMDALPITEETKLAYQSKVVGKMHACGHDGHTASLLATAHVLCHMKDKLEGKIKFIFQPAEEGGAGAKAMIEDGVLDSPRVDAIFAFHNSPGIPLGTIVARHGCTMYGNCDFAIRVQGKGGHAAQPEKTINPIVIASDVILEITAFMNNQLKESEPSVMSVTMINSGVASNVIPDDATIIGTIRTATDEKRLHAKNHLTHLCTTIADEYSANIDCQFTDIYPATINPQKETDFVLLQARLLFGDEHVRFKTTLTRASEDFSYFLQKVPGCYYFIGNGENSASCHNATYDFDDKLIPIACELFCNIAINYKNL